MRTRSAEFDYDTSLVCPPDMVASAIIAEWRRARKMKVSSATARPEPLSTDQRKRACLMDQARDGDENAVEILKKKYKLRLVEVSSD